MAGNETARIRPPWDVADRSLRYAAFGYAIGMVVHGSDHAFRGLTGDNHHAAWPGSVQIVMATLTLAISALILALVLSGHRHAPVAAIVIGFGSAAVFLLIHTLPAWGFNDSFVSPESGARVTAFSWVTAAMGIAAALWLGLVGVRARRQCTARSEPR